MEDWLNTLKDYGSKILSVAPIEGWLIAAMGAIIIMMWAYFQSQKYGDTVVGKRKLRARHRELVERANSALTILFQDSLKQNYMTQEEIDWLQNYIKKGCPEFRDLGLEPPASGKPWYSGLKPSNLAETKNRVIHRLLGMGMSTHELWTKKKNLQLARANGKSASEDLQDLVKSIREHK